MGLRRKLICSLLFDRGVCGVAVAVEFIFVVATIIIVFLGLRLMTRDRDSIVEAVSPVSSKNRGQLRAANLGVSRKFCSILLGLRLC